MVRYGPQYGPDVTFLGVDRCDWAEPETYADADVVILGAPFDGGTSHRPGTRFGPQYIRQTCYLPHDGSRPSLALRVDGLRDLRVYDAGDVEMFSGDAERSVHDLQRAVHTVTAAGAIPLILGGDHTIAWPDAAGVVDPQVLQPVHAHGERRARSVVREVAGLPDVLRSETGSRPVRGAAVERRAEDDDVRVREGRRIRPVAGVDAEECDVRPVLRSVPRHPSNLSRSRARRTRHWVVIRSRSRGPDDRAMTATGRADLRVDRPGPARDG